MIIVKYQKPFFVLVFPYNEDDLRRVKDLPVVAWYPKEKLWKVPQLAVNSLRDLICEWEDEAKEKRETFERALLKLVDYKSDETDADKDSQLYPYQVTGARFLRKAKKGLLADDMGLGKTIQSLTAVIDAGCKKVLVLCPASLKGNWAFQFKKHFDLEPLVMVGTAKERAALWESDEQFTIANYDLLVRDWDVIPKKWDAIIADEIVFLKSHSAKRTKLAKKLDAEYKFGLSGLPIENGLMEFHSIMEFIRPEILPNWFKFKERYLTVDWFGNPTGYKNLPELHMLTSPFVLRRTKGEVLTHLPPKIYSDYPLKFSAKAKKQYEYLRDDFLLWCKERGDENEDRVVQLEQFIRLRQFVEYPQVIGFDVDNVKLKWLEELYQAERKVVVFTGFSTVANMLHEHFGSDSFLLTGGTPTGKRFQLAKDFNDKDGKAIFISTDAGRFGQDLVGAPNIVHFGYTFNPASMVQREDRLHRIGQESIVNVLRPFIEGTIDEGIRKVYMDRLGISNAFMEGSEKMSSVARLSKRSFERIVYGY
jgi:SNF2 family DNA or RNA helicase